MQEQQTGQENQSQISQERQTQTGRHWLFNSRGTSQDYHEVTAMIQHVKDKMQVNMYSRQNKTIGLS